MSDRRRFLAYFSSIGLGSSLFPGVLWARLQSAGGRPVTLAMLKEAAEVAGLRFRDDELAEMVEGVERTRDRLEALRAQELDNAVVPAITFDPLLPGRTLDPVERVFRVSPQPATDRPQDLEALAFLPVTRLAELVRTRRVRAIELAEMYLARLKRHDPALHCVVTLTEDLAMRQARAADEEIQAGRYRGPLHGIPWGAKDILSVRGYPTTWGAQPFANRVLDVDASVVERLDAAGAVLVAKLSTGERPRSEG
jgi:hypothetical protein